MSGQAQSAAVDCIRKRFTVRGAVQGVGFRPFVYRLAERFGLAGYVVNSGDGVVIEVEGASGCVDAFAMSLVGERPARAEITAIEEQDASLEGGSTFVILESAVSAPHGGVTLLPDIATCPACLDEIFDPANRRYLYPFTNCTDCGPRYSILTELPYDRARTTMAGFATCEACAREYGDPADRRFHAEPIACPACGPQLALWDAQGNEMAKRGEALEQAAVLIEAGSIVAVKGLGGFHLFADARNSAALQRLRERKARPTKPFAVMVASLEEAKGLCAVDEDEVAETLLASSEAPIVLLQRNGSGVADEVAPGQNTLGLMLPYTPLHHILMRRLGFPVVATSGNLSEEPIVTTEEAALERLGAIADAFLVHDRPIARPAEDSVFRVIGGSPQAIRRGRGHAPLSLPLDRKFIGDGPSALALGGHLKSAATLLNDDQAIVGPHVGDLGSLEAERCFVQSLEHLEALSGVHADVIACDLHPDYATTHIGERMARDLVRVPHHLAHVVSVMAEHRPEGPVFGVVWDGAGYGVDGTIWGGEFLTVERGAWSRSAHMRGFRLPGSEAAMREPRRSAIGMLYEALGPEVFKCDDLAPVDAFNPVERNVLRTLLERDVQAPWTTSAGRLFDGFAALLGLTPVASHEGEAAMQLEMLAVGQGGDAYPFEIVSAEGAPDVIDWEPMLRAVLGDLSAGVAPGRIAGRVHASFASMISAIVERQASQDVILSGGCFQNRLLTELIMERIEETGRRVFLARQVPPNDGGLSLGQALWARWTSAQE